MALLKFLLDRRDEKATRANRVVAAYESPEPIGPQCHNPNCVTQKEPLSARKRFEIFSVGQNGTLIIGCAYCDHRFQVQFIGNVKTKRFCSYDNSLADAVKDWLKTNELAVFDSLKAAEELGYEPYKSGPERTLMEGADIKHALAEISRQILADCREPDRLVILECAQWARS